MMGPVSNPLKILDLVHDDDNISGEFWVLFKQNWKHCYVRFKYLHEHNHNEWYVIHDEVGFADRERFPFPVDGAPSTTPSYNIIVVEDWRRRRWLADAQSAGLIVRIRFHDQVGGPRLFIPLRSPKNNGDGDPFS